VPPQPDMASSSPNADSTDAEAAAPAASTFFDPMEKFNRRLEDIISTHGSISSLLDKQSMEEETEVETLKVETKDDITFQGVEKEVSDIMQSLNKLSSPEKKLEDLVGKYAEMAALRRCDERKLCALQQKLSGLLEERQQLQTERCSSIVARSELETLCKDLQGFYSVMREETLRGCREDEEKRNEITCHFQNMLTEIQAQIEQHSTRNDKLCRENSNLTNKLESLMNQCESREETLEKINNTRDLQHKLTEAKLQQTNALLAEAEEKHKREKEYLLREAIDKTKKCYAMREQELAMKKKLTLYSQKFDEFQDTLAKSNEIYVRFKKEMENMSTKMKNLEKESNVWKSRFENCNKALNEMVEERAEKNKEYELFVLKIAKLERLCNALQEERKILYGKIKDVRHTNSSLSLKIFAGSNIDESPDAEDAEKSELTPTEIQELQQIEEEDPILTKDMARLKEQQAKLQEFAASLLATPVDNDEDKEEEVDVEEDSVAAAFVDFQTKPRQEVDVKSEAADAPTAEEKTSETTPTDPKPEAVKDESQVEAKPVEEIQQQLSEATPEPEKVQTDPPTEQKPEAAEIPAEACEVKPAVPEEDETAKVQPAEPVQVTEEAPTKSEPAPVSENTPEPAAAASNAASSKKQVPKKKKKRSGKSAS